MKATSGRKSGSRNGEGCLVKRGKTYYGIVMINKQRFCESLKCTDAKSAQVALRTWVASKKKDNTITQKYGVIPVDEIKARVMSLMPTLPHMSKSTKHLWMCSMKMLAKWCKDNSVRNLYDIDECKARMLVSDFDGKVKNTSAGVYLRYMLKTWDTLIKDRPNPFKGIKTDNISPDKGTYKYDALTDTQLNSLMCSAKEYSIHEKDDDYYGIFLVGKYTGLRLTDCIHLRESYIDFKANAIILEPIKTRRFGKVVKIPMVDELREYLKNRLDNEFGKMVEYIVKGTKDPDDQFSGSKVGQPHYLFPKAVKEFDKDEPRWRKSLSIIFTKAGISMKPYMRDGEMYKHSFHSLRATMASRLGNSGCPINIAISIMGHSITMFQHYFRQDLDVATKFVRQAWE